MPEASTGPSSGDADLRIRAAQTSDIDDLLRLETDAFSADRLSRRRFLAHAKSPTAAMLVARRGGTLVGYALVLTRRGSLAARLYSLAVARDFTGRGIGSRLLASAEAEALKRGARSLRLEVRADNPEAVRLYERHGYRPIGRREDYYADGAAALLYARNLSGIARRLSRMSAAA